MSASSSEFVGQSWKANFLSFWTGQAFSLLGSRLVQFALIWWLTMKTGSATTLAMATLMGLLPDVVLLPVAGALVDRWNRKLVMIISDSLIALATVGLIYLFWRGEVLIGHVYAIMFLRAVAGAFQFPAMTASTSLMVPEDQLTRIQGFNQVLQGSLAIAAPPLGAFLIGILPMHQVLMIDVVTAALAIGILFFIRVPQPVQNVPQAGTVIPATGLWGDIKAGLAYVRNWPGLMAIIGIAAFIGLVVNPAFSLIPLLITKHFNGGAMQLGLFESAAGFGLIGGGLLLSAWGGFRKRVVTSMVGLVGVGAASLMMGLAPSNAFWLAVAGSGLSGALQPMISGPLMAIIQAKVAPEMQGRVVSLLAGLSNLAAPIGVALAGPVSDLIGVGTWIAFGGILCTLIGIGAFFMPVIMQMEEDHDRAVGLYPVAAPKNDPQCGD